MRRTDSREQDGGKCGDRKDALEEQGVRKVYSSQAATGTRPALCCAVSERAGSTCICFAFDLYRSSVQHLCFGLAT